METGLRIYTLLFFPTVFILLLLSHTDFNGLTCFGLFGILYCTKKIVNAQPHVLSPSQEGYSQTAATLPGTLDFSGPGSSFDLEIEQTSNVRKSL